jgi:LemA protein
MKRTNYLLFGILGFVALVLIMAFSSYNGLVNTELEVENSWSNVEVQYQRRGDLIYNLAKTVVKAAKTEQNILTEVVEARSSATSVKIDPTNLNESNMKQFEAAQEKLNGSLSRLLVVVEKYPELKSIPEFGKLNDEVAGTENRISTARSDFNGAVLKYNKKVRRFPSNIFASIFGFEKKSGFAAKAGTENAPDLDKIYDK